MMHAIHVGAAAVAIALGPIAVWAQVPRAADGKPDLTGVYQSGTTRRGSWEEANRDPSGPPAVRPPSTDRPPGPYQPWAAKRVLESYNMRGIDDPSGLCLPLGVPRLPLLGLYAQQIVQTPTQIVMLYEYFGVFRVIPLNVPHPDDLVPGYMGHSVGRWEGDTLVVDTVGFNDKGWIADVGVGNFHSDQMHVVERFTRVDKDQINYEATVEDPGVLTKPWVLRTTLMLREGTRLGEYVCAENNIDVERLEKLLKDGANIRR